MASSKPEQTRAVDPYASYNSNTVNQLTGIVTRGSDVLDYYNSLQVTPDSTSPIDHAVVLPGIVYKDDMFIQITADHRIDFTDGDQYFFDTGNPFNSETGIYYIVLDYAYTKSRPAPEATIKILLPSQTSNFRAGQWPQLFFLKAVEVLVIGQINEMFDYDPTPGNESTKREYIKSYAGSEIGLPTFDQARDQSRIIYESLSDRFYFGFSDRWEPSGGGGQFEISTQGFTVGDLVYVTSGGSLSKALSSLSISTADGVVVEVGTRGVVQTVGKVAGVPIEASNAVIKGNLLYLSGSEPGTVTKDKTSPFSQFVGRCLEVFDSTTADILFVRGAPEGTPSANLSTFQSSTLDSTAGWVFSVVDSLYYQDIDISAFLGRDVVVDLFSTDSGENVEPTDLEFFSINILRVWLPAPMELEASILGKSFLTIGLSDVETVASTLLPINWIMDSPTEYHQTIDTSDLVDGKGVVMIHDKILQEVIVPLHVYLTDSTSVTVSMPDALSTLDVTIIGESAIGGSSNITFTTTLGDGASWNPSGGKFYQDIDVAELGLSTEELVIGVRDFDTNLKVTPDLIALISETVIRIWMPTSVVSLAVTING